MGRIVIFFRSRSTDAIVRDARQMGVLREDDTWIVVCREHDRLAGPKDVTVRRAISAALDYDEMVVVGNGGTIAQVVPFVADIAETKGYTNGQGRCECRYAWEVIDLQPDGVTHLAGDRIV